MMKTFFCFFVGGILLLTATFTPTYAADLQSNDERACRQIQDKLLPVLYEAQTYARISAEQKLIHKELLKLVEPIGNFANHINGYLYSLGTPVDPEFLLKTTSTDQLDGYRFSEASPNGHCLELQFRNKTYDGAWCGPLHIICTKKYLYDAFCVRKLMPDQVQKFNEALQLRNALRGISAYGMHLEPYEYVYRIEKMIDISKLAVSKLCLP